MNSCIERILGLLAVVLLVLSGCESKQIHVRTDSDPTADFSKRLTYGWSDKAGVGLEDRLMIEPTQSDPVIHGVDHPGMGDGNDPEVNRARLDRMIREMVDSELRDKGYAQGSAGQVDFLIRYHAAVTHKINVVRVNYRYGSPASNGPDLVTTRMGKEIETTPAEPYVFEYDVGTLVLDVIDPMTEMVIWQGSAEAELHTDQPMARRTERLHRAIRQLLDRFPP